VIRQRALLALTADASRTTSTYLLASLLQELGADGAIDPGRTRVVAGIGGALEPDLDRLAAVRVLAPAADLAGEAASRLHPGARPVGERIGLSWGLATRPLRPAPGPPDLVWAAGGGALRLAAALPRPARRVPLVAHVQEMEIGLRRAVGDADPRALLARATVVVAASDAVRAHLVDDLGVAAGRVAVHHNWVPGLRQGARRTAPAERPAGVPADALVVGGCGNLGWRRGSDLFLELAGRLPAEVGARPVHLVWVGSSPRPGDQQRVAADIALRGLDDRVHLVSDGTTVRPWVAGFDVLALTAREDGCPLVALEAGALGVPVVGFDHGGLPALLPPDDHPACLVPRGDLDGLAGAIVALLVEPAARRAIGGDLRARVHAHHGAAPTVRALWADVASRLARA